jgi:hypothetical protein
MADPIQTPVTGAEHVPSGEPFAALAGFYRAFNGRDLALMERNWDTGADASMDNPLGGIRRGWTEIRAVYERLFGAGVGIRVEFHDYTLHLLGDVFLAVGRERGRLEGPGVALDLAIRTSRVFRRSGQAWRQFHHHGSIESPELLAAYRDAVR